MNSRSYQSIEFHQNRIRDRFAYVIFIRIKEIIIILHSLFYFFLFFCISFSSVSSHNIPAEQSSCHPAFFTSEIEFNEHIECDFVFVFLFSNGVRKLCRFFFAIILHSIHTYFCLLVIWVFFFFQTIFLHFFCSYFTVLSFCVLFLWNSLHLLVLYKIISRINKYSELAIE